MFSRATSKLRLMTLLALHQLASMAIGFPRATKEYRGGSPRDLSLPTKNAEPSCEQLKAMWRFSKRQSRAAEITNEIPMYRDPFAENVWEPYYARSIAAQKFGRFRNRPIIYGRLVHNPHPLRITNSVDREKFFEEFTRMYSIPQKAADTRTKLTTFQLPGGRHFVSPGFPPQTGSFQHLKELIKTERAKELQQQRAQEEAAARENQRNLARLYAHYGYVSDSSPDDGGVAKGNEDKPPNRGGGGGPSAAALIGYPSFVPRPSTMARFGAAPQSDYVYSRSGPRTVTGWTSYRPTLFDSPYNDVYGSLTP